MTTTQEQEDYAKGFEDALNSLHNKDTNPNPKPISGAVASNTMSGGGITYADAENTNLLMQIKEEPQGQCLPPSPQMSPIDMESQEKIKLERKRQRNRVAASKCRKRKLGKIFIKPFSLCKILTVNFSFQNESQNWKTE